MRRHLVRLTTACLIVGWLAQGSGCGGTAPEAPPAAEKPAAAPREPAAPPAAAAPAGSAEIGGAVSYTGEVPELKPISMSADPGCAAKHREPALSEALVLGPGGTMGNVLVRVKSGLGTASWPAPAEPVVLDQVGCRYRPHVMALVAGQTLRVLNSDGLLHNVHALPEKNDQFNMAMPGAVTQAEHRFDAAEEPFKIKCDVHPWMNAYVAVLDHPFFAVTDESGRYSIRGLPAGSYEIEAWHERLGTQTAQVTVGDGEKKSADFTFAR